MENSREMSPPKSARNQRGWPPLLACFFFLLLACYSSGGCAAPGEPLERKRPIPEAVTDLRAAQAGDDVVLTFTLPKRTADRRPLKQPFEIEIYRDFVPASTTGAAPAGVPENPALLVTIPSGVVDNDSSEGHFRFADSLKAGDFSQHAGNEAIYMVRTRASKKAASANSNVAALRIYPALEPITDLKPEVTHSGVLLTWTAPQKTIVGPAPEIAHYSIYRVESEAGTAAANTAQNTEAKMPPAKIGESDSTSFRDRQAEFGKTYMYSVRSDAKYPDKTLESGDSNWVTVSPKDIFPPVAPQGLLAVFVPAAGATPAHVELSWAVNPETDLAGYNVYRSEQDNVLGTRLNSELLLTPSFRDMNAILGRRYLYTATAVDRTGNESPASAAATGGVPAERPAAP